MRFVIPFKIISDGVSGLIPMTDIHSDLYRAKTASLSQPIQRLVLWLPKHILFLATFPGRTTRSKHIPNI